MLKPIIFLLPERLFNLSSDDSLRPRWLSGKVSALGPEGSRADRFANLGSFSPRTAPVGNLPVLRSREVRAGLRDLQNVLRAVPPLLPRLPLLLQPLLLLLSVALPHCVR
ncbi:hypothetical protein AVEN_261707-1 [Araneus ventricosus]|uniref:Uncharacterized protein n=1 Tax=Araneus ventricosus TaxID=182803 RepID=A0A4Y2DX56_ARAVE|nr:hypothetical protein AVEN_261707-1 [Araneus ventricosus]